MYDSLLLGKTRSKQIQKFSLTKPENEIKSVILTQKLQRQNEKNAASLKAAVTKRGKFNRTAPRINTTQSPRSRKLPQLNPLQVKKFNDFQPDTDKRNLVPGNFEEPSSSACSEHHLWIVEDTRNNEKGRLTREIETIKGRKANQLSPITRNIN